MLEVAVVRFPGSNCDLDAVHAAEAEARARQMCDKLLANPVTEDYLLDVETD